MTFTPQHLSPSSWNLWDTCPRRWAAKYLHGIEGPATAAMETGSFAHKTLEVLYAAQGYERTQDLARQIATQVWREDRNQWTTAGTEVTATDFKQMAWKGIEGDFIIEDPTTVDVVAVEHHARWTEVGVPFYCIIDRAEKVDWLPGLVAADYKTGKVPEKRFRGDHERQVVISAMGAAATLDGPADTGSLLYTSAEKVISVDTSLRARSEVASQAGAVWDRMLAACETHDSAQGFEAQAGPLCAYCPYADQCYEGQRRIESDLANGRVREPAKALGVQLVEGLTKFLEG